MCQCSFARSFHSLCVPFGFYSFFASFLYIYILLSGQLAYSLACVPVHCMYSMYTMYIIHMQCPIDSLINTHANGARLSNRERNGKRVRTIKHMQTHREATVTKLFRVFGALLSICTMHSTLATACTTYTRFELNSIKRYKCSTASECLTAHGYVFAHSDIQTHTAASAVATAAALLAHSCSFNRNRNRFRFLPIFLWSFFD